MKLRVIKSALVDAVSHVSKAVSQKTTIPILTGIKAMADEQGLILTASNSDITIQVRVPKRKDDIDQVFVERMGNVVLPGKIFGDIVRKLPGDEVEWVVNERYQTTIRSEQAEFQLNGLDPDEYPRLPRLSTEQMFSISADTLKSLIRQTGFAVATTEARGVLTGVHLQLEAGTLTCVATDSHRLSRQQAAVEGSAELTLNNVIIPGKSLSELAKTLADETGYVDIIVAENQILVKNDGLEFYSRLLEGTYPDINRVIPKEGQTEMVTSTRELLQSVDRASLISRDGRDNVIKWTIRDEKVEVNSASQDIGSVTEEVIAKVNGPEMSISFNARYMMEALRSIESEEIRIQFTGTMTPFVIQPLDREDSLHLIVPIRTR
ncbi:DNA polymerase III subunit beta [Paenactinomyces guangxiensis]|uniref:Beta sliding clamp n=1 Tax=Paenactinomyces guangxiensis TaxID=1490290 RepID=A0A7W2A8F7_9BACL|nr:DNA polymerase III subunit beta [Paenactinomyces guangxiensis]MBA4494117.1 DNA polymerase III subunit beta [Paenactinomyces guangxiensis]MBH8591138.1 DNA polymerase III subunit beta [Paenactinomyces guangxiensis]